jgi:hypothetical protein
MLQREIYCITVILALGKIKWSKKIFGMYNHEILLAHGLISVTSSPI